METTNNNAERKTFMATSKRLYQSFLYTLLLVIGVIAGSRFFHPSRNQETPSSQHTQTAAPATDQSPVPPTVVAGLKSAATLERLRALTATLRRSPASTTDPNDSRLGE